MQYHKRNNVIIIGVPKGKQSENGTESLSKGIMVENDPNLQRDLGIQVYEVHCQNQKTVKNQRQKEF